MTDNKPTTLIAAWVDPKDGSVKIHISDAPVEHIALIKNILDNSLDNWIKQRYPDIQFVKKADYGS